jgi:hypothetical protein
MVTVTIHCPHCGSEELKRNGHAPNGKQKLVVEHVRDKAGKILAHMRIQKNEEKRS